MIIPGMPNRPPNSVIAKITQKPDRPVESPRIFGPSTLPSNCCNRNINMTKYRQFSGWVTSTIRINRALGIAPRYGPKNGITFVTPTITLTSIAYGVPINVVPIKHNNPIIIESSTLPLMNPINVRCTNRADLRILFAAFLRNIAYRIFLLWSANFSLLAST